MRRGLLLVAIIIIVAALLLWRWPGFTVHSHNAAAVLMFVFLGLAAVQSGRRADNRRFARIYWTVAGLMAVTAVTILAVALINKEWKHAVLVLEAVEIGVFVFYWSVQTRDNWFETVPSAA